LYVVYATFVPEPVSISTFRQKAGPILTEVVHRHAPVVIQRGSDDLGLLLGRDEALALLDDRSVSPEVLRGDEGVSIWLPEFDVYGEGITYAEAKDDLLAEVRIYIDEYLTEASEYRAAPNRRRHLPHILKAHLADLGGKLADVVFPGPPAPAGQAASEELVAG
jgi:hypothetical protein